MTGDELTAAGIPMPATDGETVLTVMSALEWIQSHTTLDLTAIDTDHVKKLPSSAKLFILKWVELMQQQAGVASESLAGITQSFNSTTRNALVWQFAEELMRPFLKSQVSFVSARSSWR